MSIYITATYLHSKLYFRGCSRNDCSPYPWQYVLPELEWPKDMKNMVTPFRNNTMERIPRTMSMITKTTNSQRLHLQKDQEGAALRNQASYSPLGLKPGTRSERKTTSDRARVLYCKDQHRRRNMLILLIQANTLKNCRVPPDACSCHPILGCPLKILDVHLRTNGSRMTSQPHE